MRDWISREAVIKELKELWSYVPCDCKKYVFDIIKNTPAVEQGEVATEALATYDKLSEVKHDTK